MIPAQLKSYLEQNGVRYSHDVHGTAYTAQELAAAEHVPGNIVAKTLVVHTGDGFVLAVLQAPQRLDLDALRNALGKPQARLATEAEFARLFPDSQTGAMPPFGNLYGLPVYVDENLARDEEILFNAGTHEDTIRMRYADFARLAAPRVLPLAKERSAA